MKTKNLSKLTRKINFKNVRISRRRDLILLEKTEGFNMTKRTRKYNNTKTSSNIIAFNLELLKSLLLQN